MAANPQIPAALRGLGAFESGVVLEYLDASGVRRPADPEVLIAVLRGLGVPIGGTSEAARLLRSRRSARVERIVEPVVVLDDVSMSKVPVALREADVDLQCAIESEDGVSASSRASTATISCRCRGERVDGRDIYRDHGTASNALAVRLPRFHRPRPRSCRYSDARRSRRRPAPARGFGTEWRAFGIFAPLV